MSTNSGNSSLLYPHDARMRPGPALAAGFMQVAAMFVGCITPALIYTTVVEAPTGAQGYMLSMALFTAGIGTFLQARRLGIVGSGLLSINGTSFAYVDLLLRAGSEGGIPLACGMALAAVPLQYLLAFCLPFLNRVFSPLVAGIVVLIIGLNLIPVGGNYMIADLGEGYTWRTNALLAGTVLTILIVAQLAKHPLLRTGGPLIAIVAGYLLASLTGVLDGWQAAPTDSWIVLPQFLPYGLAFQWELLLPFAIIYMVSSLEAIGDLTATAHLSGMKTEGADYWKRMRGGILSDALASTLAGFLNAFPTATFSQNNGVIQLTGVGARRVGYYVAAILILCALLPQTGIIFGMIPKPVLGGVMLLLFGLVACAGLRMILTIELGAREFLVLALSLGGAFGISGQGEFIATLPEALGAILSSSVATGGLIALCLNLILLAHNPVHRSP